MTVLMMNNIVITKNTEMVYYLYNDEDFQLIGIDKTTCSELKMSFWDGQIDNITFLVSPNGNVYPEDELPENDRTLKGFIWRITERPETIEDLFDDLKKRVARADCANQIKSRTLKMRFDDFSITTVSRAGLELDLTCYRQLLDEAWERKGLPIRLLGLGVQLKTEPRAAKQGLQIGLFHET